jgi:hypothetical protein
VQDQFTELHVLVHALKGGNVVQRDIMQQACRFKAAVFAEQQRTGACIWQATQLSSDDAALANAPSLVGHHSSVVAGAAPGPARDGVEGIGAQAAAVGLSGGSSSDEQPPSQVQSVQSMPPSGSSPGTAFSAPAPTPSQARRPSAGDAAAASTVQGRRRLLQRSSDLTSLLVHTSSPAGAAAAEHVPVNSPAAAPSPANATTQDASAPPAPEPPARGECEAPFSLFSVRPAIESAGYSGHLQLLSAIAPYANGAAMMSTLSTICAMHSDARAALLCQMEKLPCDRSGCAASTPVCTIGSLEPCRLFTSLQPTPAEIIAVVAMPLHPLDADGCDAIDWAGLDATLAAFRVLHKWSKRSSEFSAFALLVDALVDTSFTASNGTHSSTTRIVFPVPYATHSDPDAGATLAAVAAASAASHSTATVEFIWRQWRYFDVYSSHALVRDISFSAGSLTFLTCYTWSQVGSISLTLLVVLTVLMSFPLALALYAVVLGVRWIGVLHFLGIFVILGIGVDDIFVVLDHWKVRL